MDKPILIIDDDHTVQESLQAILSEAGYAVAVAADGVGGYEQVQRLNPALILTDILLPRMHGIDLCEKLKADSQFAAIPVILMTGVYKDVSMRLHVYKGLAQDFIEKPFREGELLAKIERLIGKPAERLAAAPSEAPRDAPACRRPLQRSLDRDLHDLCDWAHGKKK